jgi:hemerythrin-like metal-binding protein
MSIEWDFVKMTTGLAEIDAQHKEWIRRFNEFDEAVMHWKGLEAFQEAFTFLEGYTETHFTLEERRMEEYRCPSRAANLVAHLAFLGKLEEIRNWVQQGGASPVEVLELKTALEEWLAMHICTIDVRLREVVGKA